MCAVKISLLRTAKQKVKRQEQQKTGAHSSNQDTNMGNDSKNWHYGASSSLLTDLHTIFHSFANQIRLELLPCQLYKSWNLILKLNLPPSFTSSAMKVKIQEGQYSYMCTAINVLSLH